MKYLIDIDYTNIKYIIYNELSPSKQRDLISYGIKCAEKESFNLDKFLKQDKTLPSILSNNLEFILYLVKNDLENIKYLNISFLNKLTNDGRESLVDSIIFSLENKYTGVEYVEEFQELSVFLNKNKKFINYIIKVNIDNIKYVDWHNLTDDFRESAIDYVASILGDNDEGFSIMNYPFRELFFQNYKFMEYLVNKDFRWIAVSRVNSKEENDRLINLFFERISSKKYKFKLNDFLEDGRYLNNNLIENKKMLHYLFVNKVSLVQYIDFFNLKSSRLVVDNYVDELEKTNIDFEFKNEDFLVDGKYPVVLSNSYRFMRYVIDKNFNHIAYMDTSMIDKREKMRIINYAFRMVYFIRGKNKKLNFDLNEVYFKNSMIINDEYFQECLRSL